MTGLSFSEISDQLGFSHTGIFRVSREWSEKEQKKKKTKRAKLLVDVRGQRRIARLRRDDRKARVTQ